MQNLIFQSSGSDSSSSSSSSDSDSSCDSTESTDSSGSDSDSSVSDSSSSLSKSKTLPGSKKEVAGLHDKTNGTSNTLTTDRSFSVSQCNYESGKVRIKLAALKIPERQLQVPTGKMCFTAGNSEQDLRSKSVENVHDAEKFAKNESIEKYGSGKSSISEPATPLRRSSRNNDLERKTPVPSVKSKDSGEADNQLLVPQNHSSATEKKTKNLEKQQEVSQAKHDSKQKSSKGLSLINAVPVRPLNEFVTMTLNNGQLSSNKQICNAEVPSTEEDLSDHHKKFVDPMVYLQKRDVTILPVTPGQTSHLLKQSSNLFPTKDEVSILSSFKTTGNSSMHSSSLAGRRSSTRRSSLEKSDKILSSKQSEVSPSRRLNFNNSVFESFPQLFNNAGKNRDVSIEPVFSNGTPITAKTSLSRNTESKTVPVPSTIQHKKGDAQHRAGKEKLAPKGSIIDKIGKNLRKAKSESPKKVDVTNVNRGERVKIPVPANSKVTESYCVSNKSKVVNSGGTSNAKSNNKLSIFSTALGRSRSVANVNEDTPSSLKNSSKYFSEESMAVNSVNKVRKRISELTGQRSVKGKLVYGDKLQADRASKNIESPNLFDNSHTTSSSIASTPSPVKTKAARKYIPEPEPLPPLKKKKKFKKSRVKVKKKKSSKRKTRKVVIPVKKKEIDQAALKTVDDLCSAIRRNCILRGDSSRLKKKVDPFIFDRISFKNFKTPLIPVDIIPAPAQYQSEKVYSKSCTSSPTKQARRRKTSKSESHSNDEDCNGGEVHRLPLKKRHHKADSPQNGNLSFEEALKLKKSKKRFTSSTPLFGNTEPFQCAIHMGSSAKSQFFENLGSGKPGLTVEFEDFKSCLIKEVKAGKGGTRRRAENKSKRSEIVEVAILPEVTETKRRSTRTPKPKILDMETVEPSKSPSISPKKKTVAPITPTKKEELENFPPSPRPPAPKTYGKRIARKRIGTTELDAVPAKKAKEEIPEEVSIKVDSDDEEEIKLSVIKELEVIEMEPSRPPTPVSAPSPTQKPSTSSSPAASPASVTRKRRKVNKTGFPSVKKKKKSSINGPTPIVKQISEDSSSSLIKIDSTEAEVIDDIQRSDVPVITSEPNEFDRFTPNEFLEELEDKHRFTLSLGDRVKMRKRSSMDAKALAANMALFKAEMPSICPAFLDVVDPPIVVPMKSYLSNGLLSTQYKLDDESTIGSHPLRVPDRVCLLPDYADDYLFVQPREYELPFDIWCFGVIDAKYHFEEWLNVKREKEEAEAKARRLEKRRKSDSAAGSSSGEGSGSNNAGSIASSKGRSKKVQMPEVIPQSWHFKRIKTSEYII